MSRSRRLRAPNANAPGDSDLQRRATAIHEAGHAIMAICLGGMISPEGVEIDDRQYCGSRFFIDPSDLDTRERITVLHSLAGWRAEHLWHGRGDRERSRDDLEHCVYNARCIHEEKSWEANKDLGDDYAVFIEMLHRTPAASDNELIERYYSYSNLCYRILSEPTVCEAIERLAGALVKHSKLHMAEAVEAIGGSTFPIVSAAGRVERMSHQVAAAQ